MAAIDAAATPKSEVPASIKIAFAVLVAVLVMAPLPPFEVYPVFLMKALCFALFACAFNLLIGYGGLLSFGHAMFFGWAAYVAAHLAKVGTISLPYWASEWNWLVIPLPPQSPEIAEIVHAGWKAIRQVSTARTTQLRGPSTAAAMP